MDKDLELHDGGFEHRTDEANQFIEQQKELAKEVFRDVPLTVDPDKFFDTLIQQIITNTGEELMRLAEGEKKHIPVFEGLKIIGEYKEIAHAKGYNKSIDTLKKHITSVTGVE